MKDEANHSKDESISLLLFTSLGVRVLVMVMELVMPIVLREELKRTLSDAEEAPNAQETFEPLQKKKKKKKKKAEDEP